MPENKGCGNWQEGNDFPKDLTHPMPPIEKPEPFISPIPEITKPTNEVCGKPIPGDEKLTGELPGCGHVETPKSEDFILHAKWTGSDGVVREEGDLSGLDVKIRDDNRNHIFDDRDGHVIDTPENRDRITGLVKDPSKYLGPSKWGNWWYGETLPDGTQLWAEVRGEKIINCGLNEIPQPYNPDSGLCDFDPSKQRK